MPSIVSDLLFTEPSGPPQSLVQFGAAAVYLGLYAWAWTRGEAVSSSWLLVMVVGTGLAGLAESLPEERRRVAGILRALAVLVLSCLLAVVFFAPELIVG